MLRDCSSISNKFALVLIQETPPDGEQFANVVKHVLEREEFWNNWKNEGCPPFDKPKINACVPIIRKPRKKPVGEDILEGLSSGFGFQVKIGQTNLTFDMEPHGFDELSKGFAFGQQAMVRSRWGQPN